MKEARFVTMDSERHVYKLKWWAWTGYLFLGILLGGLALILAVIAILGREWPDLRSFAAMILCSLVGYVFLRLTLRSRVILEGGRLAVRYAFGEDSTQISKIVGYRVVRSRSGTYWALRLRNGSSITIMRSFAVDDYFRDFIAQLRPIADEDEPTAAISE